MFARFSFLTVIAVLASGCANTSPVIGGKNISYGDTNGVISLTMPYLALPTTAGNNSFSLAFT